jgi:hypothetical protein
MSSNPTRLAPPVATRARFPSGVIATATGQAGGGDGTAGVGCVATETLPAVGDFDVYSDADFPVILEKDISAAQLSGLQSLHRQIFGLPSLWAQHLERSYLPKAALRHLPPPSREFLYLDHGSRELVRSDHDDSLVVYWVLRERGIVLAGPEPRSLVTPVSVDALQREILETMAVWRQHFLANPDKLNNRAYQPFAVLSYCRMLHTLRLGTVESKRAGATWAKEALDARWRQLIQRAWENRPGDASQKVRQEADPADLQSTWEFMEYALALGREWHSA